MKQQMSMENVWIKCEQQDLILNCRLPGVWIEGVTVQHGTMRRMLFALWEYFGDRMFNLTTRQVCGIFECSPRTAVQTLAALQQLGVIVEVTQLKDPYFVLRRIDFNCLRDYQRG